MSLSIYDVRRANCLPTIYQHNYSKSITLENLESYTKDHFTTGRLGLLQGYLFNSSNISTLEFGITFETTTYSESLLRLQLSPNSNTQVDYYLRRTDGFYTVYLKGKNNRNSTFSYRVVPLPVPG